VKIILPFIQCIKKKKKKGRKERKQAPSGYHSEKLEQLRIAIFHI
jgi:hypothetical protein